VNAMLAGVKPQHDFAEREAIPSPQRVGDRKGVHSLKHYRIAASGPLRATKPAGGAQVNRLT
jgi:hypothetical protein